MSGIGTSIMIDNEDVLPIGSCIVARWCNSHLTITFDCLADQDAR